MNLYFDGTITNKLEQNPDVSVTVFKKKEEGWEKMLDPFCAPDSNDIPKIEEWRKSITLSLALNYPIGDKTCKVTKIENGTCSGPTKVGNFKWELEITSNHETWQDPNNTTFSVEISDNSVETSDDSVETSDDSAETSDDSAETSDNSK